MERKAYQSQFASLRATMEQCSEIVAEAYSHPPEELEIFTGELPPGHRSTDRRQRYWVTERGGDLFVALPGTTHPLDWSSNLRVYYKPIDGSDVPSEQLEDVPCAHAGFYYRAETVPVLKLLQQAADKGCRLVLTGHSLGGAVANLCALAVLSAQQRAITAAADKAAAAAAETAQRSSPSRRRRRRKSRLHTRASAAANNVNNHSCCSSNSDFALSPQAALTEVLCVSFASPVFANAALVAHIEESGWEESFVNVVVPEDYCLKLFNNVLTSAQPEARTISRTTSRSSLTGSSSQQLFDYQECPEPYEPELEPEQAAACAEQPPADLADGLLAGSAAAAAAAAAAAGSSSRDEVGCSSTDGSKQRYSYTGQQQPLASALAGKGARSRSGKRQLSFAHPLHETLDNDAAADAASIAGASLGLPCVAACASSSSTSSLKCQVKQQQAMPGAGWSQEQQQQQQLDGADDEPPQPSSPSSGSLYSEGSLSSTRSWTLLAYLPDMFAKSFSARSFSSWGSGSSSSREPSDSGMTAEAAEDVFASWGMRHARSTVDLTHGLGLSDDGSSSSSSGSSSSLCHMDDLEAAATFFTGMGGLQDECAEQQCEQQHGHDKQQHQQQQQGGLRRSVSSASLAIFSQGHRKLLQPLRSRAGSDSLSLVSSLLPSMRKVVSAGRSVVNVASSITERALNVPLDVLEVGLIKALKPPMYQPVGQQWILSATGLVPQQQEITQYPRHVHDVFWHKELMLVAFREHSIGFYKHRLLKQASRR